MPTPAAFLICFHISSTTERDTVETAEMDKLPVAKAREVTVPYEVIRRQCQWQFCRIFLDPM
jgi:hypothetical protein